MKSKFIAALVASAGLVWGTAHAAPDVGSIPSEGPVIVLQLEPIPGVEPGSEQEQALINLLVLQLLSALQADGESLEAPMMTPTVGQSI